MFPNAHLELSRRKLQLGCQTFVTLGSQYQQTFRLPRPSVFRGLLGCPTIDPQTTDLTPRQLTPKNVWKIFWGCLILGVSCSAGVRGYQYRDHIFDYFCPNLESFGLFPAILIGACSYYVAENSSMFFATWRENSSNPYKIGGKFS